MEPSDLVISFLKRFTTTGYSTTCPASRFKRSMKDAMNVEIQRFKEVAPGTTAGRQRR